MPEIFIPSGILMRGDGATIRLPLVADDSREFITPDETLQIRADLFIKGRGDKPISSWFLEVDDVLTDGPVFHAQDPGWPHTDKGYNFIWRLPSGYTTQAPARYRLVFTVQLTELRQATALVDLNIGAPETYA